MLISSRSNYLILIVLFALSACSSIPPKQVSNDLENKIAQSRVILVGETHDDYGHHLNQLEIIKTSHKKWGGVLTIGLEMVQQPFQQALDEYISGKITERDMLKGVEWYSRWRFDFRLYRPIFDYAKRHSIPLIALNIPQELTRKISKSGIQNLTKFERKQLPELIDKSNIAYTNRLKKIFGQHSHGKTFNQKGFNKFVEAQLTWDEGMAFAASNYLKENPRKRMVILAGSGHLIHHAGIPNRLNRQLQLTKDKKPLVILSHNDEPYTTQEADFSLKAKDPKLAPLGLIGIGMKDSNQGVQVSSIVKNGAAEKAGLQKEDTLLKLNQTIIKTSEDVSLWRLDKLPKETVDVLLRRGKQQLIKRVVLGG